MALISKATSFEFNKFVYTLQPVVGFSGASLAGAYMSKAWLPKIRLVNQDIVLTFQLLETLCWDYGRIFQRWLKQTNTTTTCIAIRFAA